MFQWIIECLSRIEHNQSLILKGQEKLMGLVTVDSTKIDAVNTAIETLTIDTSAALADIAAKISALQNQTPDPATATELGNILTSVQTLDTNIKAADPGVIPPAPPAGPPTSQTPGQ